MKKPRKLNKAVTDSISTLLDQGINVNINIPTEVCVKIVFMAIIITAVVGGASLMLHSLKSH